MLPKALAEPATGGRAGGVRERGGRRRRSAAERAAESREEGAPGVPSSIYFFVTLEPAGGLAPFFLCSVHSNGHANAVGSARGGLLVRLASPYYLVLGLPTYLRSGKISLWARVNN